MLNLNLQFFAHKKGMGSTKNGRDSNAKRLGAKKADGQFVKAGKKDGVLRFERFGKFRKRASVHPVETAEAAE